MVRTLPTVPVRPTDAGDLVVILASSAQASMRLLLEAEGSSVIDASTVESAISALERGALFVVVASTVRDEEVRRLVASADAAHVAVMGYSTDHTVEARLRMFRLGAVECVSVDMDDREVAARARALARRLGHVPELDKLVLGPLSIDMASREVLVRGHVVELTAREFDLLAFLAAHPGTVYRREQLLAAVWHSSIEWQQPATVTEHIRRLRTKLESDPTAPELLRTVRGVGYTLDRRGTERRDGPSALEAQVRFAALMGVASQ